METLGIHVGAAFAGLAGGLVGAWADGKAGLTLTLSYAGAGLLTANWLAEPFTRLSPVSVNEGVAGFIVGGCALVIVRTIKGAVSRWAPNIAAKVNGDGRV